MSEDLRGVMGQGPYDFEPEQEWLPDGFHVVDPTRLITDAGMTSHRGVLVGDEYLDDDVLRATIEESLGYSYEDVSSVYARGGRLSTEQRQLRARIDARLLALSRSGGNLTLLAKTLDLGTSTVDRAIARAKEHEVTPIVKNPAVRSNLVCFTTGERGAKAQRRRHQHCPSHLLPTEDRRYSTINLLDSEYAKGDEPRPGSPAYWEFRLRTR